MLQEKLGQGHYNAATTRVLHMVHNPAADAERGAERAQLAELQSANTALTATLQSLQAAAGDGGTSLDATATHSRAVTEAELAIAQQKVRGSATALQLCSAVLCFLRLPDRTCVLGCSSSARCGRRAGRRPGEAEAARDGSLRQAGAPVCQ